MSLPFMRWGHEKLNQIGTRTGRLSCSQPNISNIPRSDYNESVKKVMDHDVCVRIVDIPGPSRRLDYLFNLRGSKTKISETSLLGEEWS